MPQDTRSLWEQFDSEVEPWRRGRAVMATIGAFYFLIPAVLCVAAQAQQDPLIGTWKQNMAKSKYDPANLTPKSGTTVKREASIRTVFFYRPIKVLPQDEGSAIS